VVERAESHPYGPDWCCGFSQATLDAADDIAMYAATETLPAIDRKRLQAARTAARHLSPLSGMWPARPARPNHLAAITSGDCVRMTGIFPGHAQEAIYGPRCTRA
jgi:hypothetical protein